MKTRKKRRMSPLMKALLVIETIAVTLLLVLCIYKEDVPVFANVTKIENPDVILDAGHGGFDSGSVAQGLQEKDINLSVTLEIGRQLENAGYKVEYIRDSDEVNWANEELEDLEYRLQESNKSGAKLFVSIHVNSEEEDYGSYGYEVWGKMKDEKVHTLAQNILDSVDTLGYSQNRGLKDQDVAPLYVLHENKIPAVLLELGFIYSEIDQAYLVEGYTQTKMACKIADGIKKTLVDMVKVEDTQQKEKT